MKGRMWIGKTADGWYLVPVIGGLGGPESAWFRNHLSQRQHSCRFGTFRDALRYFQSYDWPSLADETCP